MNSENMTETSLQRAVSYLKAKRVGPQKFAYYADETRRYYIVDENDMQRLGSILGDSSGLGRFVNIQEGLAYSVWCSSSTAIEMPKWWEPERSYAVQYQAEGAPLDTNGLANGEDVWKIIGTYTTVAAAEDARAENESPTRIITADVETGAEVKA